MATASPERNFWATLPGILTGIAALTTALTGLLLGLLQYGAFEPDAKHSGEQALPAGEVRVSQDVDGAAQVSTFPSDITSHADEPTVALTSRDGTLTTVYLDGFRHGTTGQELHLRGGQTITFDRINSIDVTRVSDNHASVRIALTDGRTVEGSIASGSSVYTFSGDNDLGRYWILIEDLSRLAFQR
jgi:hypothetical protein